MLTTNGSSVTYGSITSPAVFAGILAHEITHVLDTSLNKGSDAVSLLLSNLISEGKAEYNNMIIDEQVMNSQATQSNPILAQGISVEFSTIPAGVDGQSSDIDANAAYQNIKNMSYADAVLYLAGLTAYMPESVTGQGTPYWTYYLQNIPNTFPGRSDLSSSLPTSVTISNAATSASPNEIDISVVGGDKPVLIKTTTYKGLGDLLSQAQSSTSDIVDLAAIDNRSIVNGGSGVEYNLIISDSNDSTLYAGSGNNILISNGNGQNIIYGKYTNDGDASTIMIASDASGVSASNTFYYGSGDNIIIGGAGKNTFDIANSELTGSDFNTTGSVIIWGGGGTSVYNIDFPVHLIFFVWMANPTAESVANLDVDSVEAGLESKIGEIVGKSVIIINPSKDDSITLGGGVSTGNGDSAGIEYLSGARLRTY